MGTPVFQKTFNSGEWAPQLYSRVDLEKYKAGAALLRNFFVDYRGGASTRTGTQYILQAYESNKTVRVIPFQASVAVSYILEFGDYYIRFYYNGAPILESAYTITGATQANPCVLSVVNSYTAGDWVYISGVVGMTQLNGNYYKISAATAGSITLADLNGNAIDSTGYTAYTSGGASARVYTLTSPYAAADINLIKFAQSINSMILCHPSYAPQVLTLISANNWTISAIDFGSSASAPTGLTANTTLAAGLVNYSYVVTTHDSSGNESIASAAVNLTSLQDLRNTYGSISISWSPVTGGVSYDVYKSDVSYFGIVPAGVPYGFIGNVNGNTIIDSNISPDFSNGPPTGNNPFQGSAVASITQGTAGAYTTVPAVTLTGGSPNATANAQAILSVQGTPTIGAGGTGYVIGDTISLVDGVIVKVATIGGGGAVATFNIITSGGSNAGSLAFGATPTNPVAQVSTSGVGTGCTVNLIWGVSQTLVTYGGNGYLTVPTVNYFPTGASATAVLTAATAVNPGVPSFFQQRMILAAATIGPETLAFSQPGSYYNFNTSNPTQASDAIQVTLASGQLETIKSMIPTSAGLIIFTDKSSWLLTGGSLGSAISPSAIVANRQSYNGASDVPPILNNFDVLYVEEKGSAVRDATYNYYAQIFTGQDISAVSSHLFYGYQITQWTWAQAPFKVVWAIRNDGVLLALTFAKEEEFIAWTHHDTNGLFMSVASIPETIADGMIIDAVYTVVQRTINGNTVQYIERFANRVFSSAAKNAWCVDAGIQYSGSPVTAFSGAQQLAGMTVTGLADGVVIPPFTMPVSGSFTLSAPASLVTVGLAFTAQLQTLPIDTGEPTIQGRDKKINAVTVRCVDTLGLSIGSSFTNLVAMQDLIVGNMGSMTNQRVTDLVTGDARTFVDPLWATQGQFCIQQSLPLPATITGVIPQLTVGK